MAKQARVMFIVSMLAIVAAVVAVALYRFPQARSLVAAGVNASELPALPANRWHLYYQPLHIDWRRQAHAGIAYDPTRATFYIFGSDIHGQNWDNSVHEFDPETKAWSTHYAAADPESYRVDERGIGVSGEDQVLPWAMHTFDNVLYDPLRDALVVISRPDHNPVNKRIGESPRVNPVWFYSLTLRAWGVQEILDQDFPVNFAGSSAYDAARQTLVSYGSGMAELGPARDVWQKVAVSKPHKIHHSMEYDSLRRQLAVFGDYSNSNRVWVYTPGVLPGAAGVWEERSPGGDPCPPDQHFPVAFDEHSGVFLIVPDNNPGAPSQKKDKNGKETSSSTFVYDPDRNQYRKLPDGDMPALGMNYMMVYDSRRRVFFLVTGDWRRPPTVWALRLSLAALRP